MRIGIDARMYGPNVGGGGLGRYVEQLVGELAQQTDKNRYVLFLKNQNQATSIQDGRFKKRYTSTHWYTLAEQLKIPRLVDRENLDLIHFPHWNVPLWLKTPFIVTIHDLILLEEPRSAKATTRHPLIYKLKYRAYRHALTSTLKRAHHIIAVSQYTKQSILKFFPHIPKEKITVVYEGLTDLHTLPTSTDRPVQSPYLLYVGNAYPHKNLERLLSAFKLAHKQHPNLHLVLAGRNDLFYQRLKNFAHELKIDPELVHFMLNPSDQDLANLYQHAQLYVFPSRSEGFGLPPLEAMSFNLPVAAANRSCLPEILGDAAIYFDPDDAQSIATTISRTLTDKTLRSQLVQKGQEQIKRYSWSDMAKEIHAIYQTCA